MRNSGIALRRVTVSAVFLSLAVVVKLLFSLDVPLFGNAGLRLDLSGIFSIMPAILFGPIYGAVIAGLTDVLSFILKPTGAYMPLLTLAIVSGGLLRGLLWRLLRGREGRHLRIFVTSVCAAVLALGVSNAVVLAIDGVDRHFYERMAPAEALQAGESMHLVSRLLLTGTAGRKNPGEDLSKFIMFLTVGLISAALFGLLLLVIDLVISKKLRGEAQSGQTMAVLITMVFAGLVVTTLNTIVLRNLLFVSWKELPFAVVWLPRAAEELISSTVQAFAVSALLGVMHKQKLVRGLVK